MDRTRGIGGSLQSIARAIGRPFASFFIATLPLVFYITLVSLIQIKKLLRFPRFPRWFVFGPVTMLVFIMMILASIGVLTGWLHDLPSPKDLQNHRPKLTTHILDREGRELYKIYKDENRSLVSLNELPEFVSDATVAIEDKEFWNHAGFSVSGILRALLFNLSSNFELRTSNLSLQGGSTITQQLIKNTILSPEKTFRRKVREVVLAALIERTYEKREILEMYLNEVSFGGTAYGIQEAAQQYFGKDARDLTLAEAALLAGLPAAPTIYSPFGVNPDRARDRQQEVLRRMVEDGYVNETEARAASREPLAYRDGVTNIDAPHFVMYVRDFLVRAYGEDLVTHGGLRVTTTLDLPLQHKVQEIVTKDVDELARLRVGNGAALVTAPPTGEILAMVGSRNYFDYDRDGQVNVVLRPRQPGSSIKPIMYAAALQHGFTPASVILDAPVTFNIPGSAPYSPVNYDGRFHGPVPLRTALGSSYNVPAVKVLSTIGLDAMIDQGEKMGITTWDDRSRFGLALTLGGGEVTMFDMAEAYGTLANGGIRVPLNPILRVEDAKGKVLYAREQDKQMNGQVDKETNRLEKSELSSNNPLIYSSTDLLTSSETSRALPSSVAFQLTSILSDPWARAPAFGTRSVLTIPDHEVAVKTGTTNSLRDNWTFGYTTDVLVATWVGNNDNSPMNRIASGITGASPIWASIMKEILSTKEEPHRFPKTDELVAVKICTLTGQRACEGCPTREELFVPGTEPKDACRPEAIEELKKKREEEKQRDQILRGETTTR